MKYRLLIFIIITAAALAVNAQETPRKWKFHLDGSGVINSGNVNSISISQGGGASRNDSIIAFNGSYKYIFGAQDDVISNRELNTAINFDLWQYNRFSPFVSVTDLINRFKGFDNKLSLLTGAKFRIYSMPDICDYSVSLAFLGEFIDYSGDADGLRTEIARFSLRAKMKQKISDNVIISHTTFYQPAIHALDDYTINSVTRIDTRIHKNLLFGVVLTYEFRSVIPEGVMNHDMRTELSLRVTF